MPSKKSKAITLRTLPDEFQVPGAVQGRIAALRETLDAAAQRIARGERPQESAERQDKITARQSVQRGQPLTLDDVATQERVIGSDDLLSVGFFSRGLLAARSVARLFVMPLNAYGTGFLVAPDMLMTNNHVLPMASVATATEVSFELFDTAGNSGTPRKVRLDPERFFFTHPALDITVVALRDSGEAHATTADLGWHPMIAQEGKIRIGDPVNIIQHPGGRSKKVVVHNSNLLHIENREEDGAEATVAGAEDDGSRRDPYLWYSSDTERGSSGAPVFNVQWEVVGVHRRSVPDTNKNGELIDAEGQPIDAEAFRLNPDLAVWIANEGTRTSRIVAALEKARFERSQLATMRDELLSLWEGSRGHNKGQEAAARATRVPGDVGLESAAVSRQPIRAGGITLQITIAPDNR